jgi:hypothetical protein
MSARLPFTQAALRRAIVAAKQAGAAEVELRMPGAATIVIRILSPTNPEIDLAGNSEIIL